MRLINQNDVDLTRVYGHLIYAWTTVATVHDLVSPSL